MDTAFMGLTSSRDVTVCPHDISPNVVAPKSFSPTNRKGRNRWSAPQRIVIENRAHLQRKGIGGWHYRTVGASIETSTTGE